MLAESNLPSLDSLHNNCVNSFKYGSFVNINALVMHFVVLVYFGTCDQYYY